jgi:hypothetical protein
MLNRLPDNAPPFVKVESVKNVAEEEPGVKNPVHDKSDDPAERLTDVSDTALDANDGG